MNGCFSATVLLGVSKLLIAFNRVMFSSQCTEVHNSSYSGHSGTKNSGRQTSLMSVDFHKHAYFLQITSVFRMCHFVGRCKYTPINIYNNTISHFL